MAVIHLADRAGISRALTRAALCAMEAPSPLATRPWRWRIDHDAAGLDADPGDRLTVLGCGAALHHATVALAAHGIGVETVHFPGPGTLGRIASLRYTGPIEPEPYVQRLHRAIAARGLDRRPIGSSAVPDSVQRRLEQVAAAAGATLRHGVVSTGGASARDWLAHGEAVSAVLLNAVAEGLVTSLADGFAVLRYGPAAR